MSSEKNDIYSSEDLKTDSVPDVPRSRDLNDEENDSSLLLPPKEVVDAERESSPANNDKAYLRPPEYSAFGTKTKSSPRSVPKSPKNKKEKKKSSEPSTVVYKISHSNGIHIGPDLNLTIVQNSPSAKAQSAPKENRITRSLLESKQQVTREHIRLVAPHVGEHWREVGRMLNLTDGRLEQIEQDRYKEGMREVVYQILLEWIRVNASDARLGELTNALWKSAEYSAVKKLAEWAKESSLF
ncbi:hypothetical protein B7P43_G06525 [Cryptotermes secundus]|uniref:Death domain-containing protein n=1 Tax=Cryptotermes secundus TaxID=105785 RepID=A0A2J7RHF3_9NEOP|nr:protein immune deficiency [Cryptotermes secundus]XP_023727856.1 protein immune deficiency [Cryptotermes secundus]PNF40266.1 hypothetical protein B7P43_G06525 [Cryptotermes secundus]